MPSVGKISIPTATTESRSCPGAGVLSGGVGGTIASAVGGKTGEGPGQ